MVMHFSKGIKVADRITHIIESRHMKEEEKRHHRVVIATLSNVTVAH